MHYHAHRGLGGGKLGAHGRYLERDGAGEGGEPGQFYDRHGDAEEAPLRLAAWEADDRRHVRIILAPESGARFADLKDMTRATMTRVERDLGVPLEWMAVDHFNTDNPHTHIILRGRRHDGPDLTIPRDYATHGFRHAARDVASEMLGERGREDERLALSREIQARGFTRLDGILEKRCAATRPVNLRSIGRDLDTELAAALRGRLRSLVRMGLATESARDFIHLATDWKDRLQSVEGQVDIKRILNRSLAPDLPKTRLYAPALGPLSGEVMIWGKRGEDGTKAFVVVRPEKSGPVLVNTSAKTIQNISEGDIAFVRQSSVDGRRASLTLWKPELVRRQTEELAFNSLDQELVRRANGLSPVLPRVQVIDDALLDRAEWLERHGLANRDLHGALSLSDNLPTSLKALELRHAEDVLARETGKPILKANDVLEREWRVRSTGSLKQGRYAALERADGVAILRLSSTANIAVGKAYAIKATAKGVKITPSLGLER